LESLSEKGQSGVINLGYGHGYSVREVVQATKRVTAVDFPVEETGRREGDPPSLVADNTKARKVLGWIPKYDDLGLIVKTAWEWEGRLSSMRSGSNLGEPSRSEPRALSGDH